MDHDDFDEDLIYHEMYLHLLWSTKNQQPVLSPIAPHLYTYLCDLALSKDCHLVSGKVFDDHVQLIIKFSPDVALNDLLITFKTATSLWIRSNFPELKDFEWQLSDFSFTVDYENPFIIDTEPQPFSELIEVVLNNNGFEKGIEYNLKEVLE